MDFFNLPQYCVSHIDPVMSRLSFDAIFIHLLPFTNKYKRTREYFRKIMHIYRYEQEEECAGLDLSIDRQLFARILLS